MRAEEKRTAHLDIQLQTTVKKVGALKTDCVKCFRTVGMLEVAAGGENASPGEQHGSQLAVLSCTT